MDIIPPMIPSSIAPIIDPMPKIYQNFEKNQIFTFVKPNAPTHPPHKDRI